MQIIDTNVSKSQVRGSLFDVLDNFCIQVVPMNTLINTSFGVNEFRHSIYNRVVITDNAAALVMNLPQFISASKFSAGKTVLLNFQKLGNSGNVTLAANGSDTVTVFEDGGATEAIVAMYITSHTTPAVQLTVL